MPDLRTVFAGSPEFAVRILSVLATGPHRPLAVFTQPDRPRGRGRRLQPSPVKQCAEHLGLPVHQPFNLKDEEAVASLAQYRPDVFIVVAYGLILPRRILGLPPLGCVNVHASLLPRWRGAAPIEHAIMAGDAETGVSIMAMEAGLDTGPVFRQAATPIRSDTEATALEARLADLGGRVLIQVLDDLNSARSSAQSGTPANLAVPQNHAEATYAPKITAADRKVDWTQSAEVIARRVQALAGRSPVRCRVGQTGVQLLQARAAPPAPLQTGAVTAPGAIVSADRNHISIVCGTGQLHVIRLKVELGKGAAMSSDQVLNAYPELLQPGRRLDSP